jgi:hypothetical protein
MADNSARLAAQILRAMEAGSANRLREELDYAANMPDAGDRVSPQEEEQREVLSAIAEQWRRQAWPSEVHLRLLHHFAGTVQVCLS